MHFEHLADQVNENSHMPCHILGIKETCLTSRYHHEEKRH